MNKILTGIILCSSTLVFSCHTNDNAKTTDSQTIEMSSAEKETAKKEISGRIEEVIKGVKELNVEAAIKPYSSDTSFRIVNPDASVTNYQTMKNDQTAFFKTIKSMSFTTVKEDFTFLSKDLIMCTWTGNNAFELKTGEKMKIDPYVGSLLFSKKDNEWKIIYAHESSAQPVKIVKK